MDEGIPTFDELRDVVEYVNDTLYDAEEGTIIQIRTYKNAVNGLPFYTVEIAEEV